MGWTFLTNHAQVLLCIAQNPRVTTREIAARVGITERQIQRIVGDLAEGGHLTKARDGRANVYQIHPEHVLQHAAPTGKTVGDLLRALERGAGGGGLGEERSTGG